MRPSLLLIAQRKDTHTSRSIIDILSRDFATEVWDTTHASGEQEEFRQRLKRVDYALFILTDNSGPTGDCYYTLGVVTGCLEEHRVLVLCNDSWRAKLPHGASELQMLSLEGDSDKDLEEICRRIDERINNGLKPRRNRDDRSVLELAGVTPSVLRVSEQYTYKTKIANTRETKEQDGAEPKGFIQVIVPYDGHRHFPKRLGKLVQRSLGNNRFSRALDANIGALEFTSFERTDLEERIGVSFRALTAAVEDPCAQFLVA